jgi:hypothetical protein
MTGGFSDDFPDVVNSCIDAMYTATDSTKATMIAAGAFLWLTILWNASDGDGRVVLSAMREWVTNMEALIESGKIDAMFDEDSAIRPTLQ